MPGFFASGGRPLSTRSSTRVSSISLFPMIFCASASTRSVSLMSE